MKVEDEKIGPVLPPLPALERPSPAEPVKKPVKRNFQKEAFEDRRVLTEVFLNSLNLKNVNTP